MERRDKKRRRCGQRPTQDKDKKINTGNSSSFSCLSSLCAYLSWTVFSLDSMRLLKWYRLSFFCAVSFLVLVLSLFISLFIYIINWKSLYTFLVNLSLVKCTPLLPHRCSQGRAAGTNVLSRAVVASSFFCRSSFCRYIITKKRGGGGTILREEGTKLGDDKTKCMIVASSLIPLCVLKSSW